MGPDPLTTGGTGPFPFCTRVMARSVPQYEPKTMVAGDSLQWDRLDLSGDYPPASWTLTYYLTGPANLTITADENGDAYEVRVEASETAGLPAGTYRLRGFVSDGTDRWPVYKGRMTVEANPATVAPGGTHAEKMLVLIESALEGRLPKDKEQYQIDGVSIVRIPVERLLELRVKYQQEVYSQRSGGFKVGSVGVRF